MIISEESKIKDLADSIVHRTYEVYQYDLNISNYQAILDSSDGVYPDHLVALKNVPFDQAISQCPIEDLEELAELQQRERISSLIRTEIVERTKSNGILKVLSTQLKILTGEDGYDIAINEAKIRLGK